MPQMIALIGGLNKSGQEKVSMSQLREIFLERAATDVVTYQQNGNIIFSGAGSAFKWARELRHALKAHGSGDVAVMIRTQAELAKVVVANPFLKLPKAEKPAFHVAFLDDMPGAAGLKKLASVDAGGDRFHSIGRELYLFCPNGYARSKLTNAVIEKALSLRVTTRNWTSVNKLAALMFRFHERD